MLTRGIGGLEASGHRLCVVGSGPVGLALATDLVQRGQRVLLLESGGEVANPDIQALSNAELVDRATHSDMAIAVARRLGGTSNLWGARCLPYDPIDFEHRPWVNARWPISFNDFEPWIAPAVEATQSGASVYREGIQGVEFADDRFDVTALERWANQQQAQAIHGQAIFSDPRLDVRTHATLVDMVFAEDGRVTDIEIAHSLSGERVRLPVETLVLAAGGVETARLMLAARRKASQRFGGEQGPLGRFYMGHVVGEIADIIFPDCDNDRIFEFHVDSYGSYVRRRFVPNAKIQRDYRLLNSALWPVVPKIADPRHGSAILSLVYLAMSVGPIGSRIVAEAIRQKHAPPGQSRLPHIGNLVTGLPAAAAFGFDFLRRRYNQATRMPAFFVRNGAHRYGLQFHSEQAPRAESRVGLTAKTDRLGLPRLLIDYRFSSQDADSVVRTHELLNNWLQATGFARLEFRWPRDLLGAAVLEQASHGSHQVGLVRMGASASDGVVDGDLRCFGVPNLFVAGAAVLPTSGQANPTLTAIALALRLSASLAQEAAHPITAIRAD